MEQPHQQPVQPEWTSDLLLEPGGMTRYCDQVRADFRAIRTEFRSLATEVQGDLVADPMPEDAAWQARLHAWRVAKVLRDMERSAQRIVTLAKQLDATYERTYVQLPKDRAKKAAAKRERDARRVELAARPAPAALSSVPPSRPEDEPVAFELFPGAARRR